MTDLVTNADLVNAIGILGVSLYLGSYAALQTGFLRGQGYLYPAINMAAASCVLRPDQPDAAFQPVVRHHPDFLDHDQPRRHRAYVCGAVAPEFQRQ